MLKKLFLIISSQFDFLLERKWNSGFEFSWSLLLENCIWKYTFRNLAPDLKWILIWKLQFEWYSLMLSKIFWFYCWSIRLDFNSKSNVFGSRLGKHSQKKKMKGIKPKDDGNMKTFSSLSFVKKGKLRIGSWV